MSNSQFITVHDADSIRKRQPVGREVRVRVASVDTIRPYEESKHHHVRTVLGIHGSYLHVTETEDEIQTLITGLTA